MTHNELVVELAGRLNWTTDKLQDTLKESVEIIKNELLTGNTVSIRDFGVLNTKLISEYISLDSETNERFLVPPRVDIAFSPSNSIKEEFSRINNS